MTEKESLLVLNQEIKSDLSFCRDCAVSQGATGWVKDFDRLLDKIEILKNRLNQQFSSHSKLSIPKKIAESLNAGDLMFLAWTHANDLLGKVPDEERKTEIIRRNALARAYQAGKALGVELVEVTDE